MPTNQGTASFFDQLTLNFQCVVHSYLVLMMRTVKTWRCCGERKSPSFISRFDVPRQSYNQRLTTGECRLLNRCQTSAISLVCNDDNFHCELTWTTSFRSPVRFHGDHRSYAWLKDVNPCLQIVLDTAGCLPSPFAVLWGCQPCCPDLRVYQPRGQMELRSWSSRGTSAVCELSGFASTRTGMGQMVA